MGLHSGRWGVINGVSTVRNFSIQDEHTSAMAVASNTGFGTARRAGINDWTGNFAIYGKTSPVYPGESFAFDGYVSPDDDISGVGGHYSGTALVSQMALEMNWAGGDMIGIAVDFGGHLALTGPTPGGAQLLDSTTPNLLPIAGCYVEWSSDGSTWNTWANLVQLTWTWTNALQTFVNSSTQVSSVLWTGRRAGNHDWNISAVEQEDNRGSPLMQKRQEVWLRLHMDNSGTNYWELKTGIVKNFTGIVIDRETGKINQRTVNIEMNSNLVTTGALGHVRKPDGTMAWGV